MNVVWCCESVGNFTIEDINNNSFSPGDSFFFHPLPSSPDDSSFSSLFIIRVAVVKFKLDFIVGL